MRLLAIVCIALIFLALWLVFRVTPPPEREPLITPLGYEEIELPRSTEEPTHDVKG